MGLVVEVGVWVSLDSCMPCSGILCDVTQLGRVVLGTAQVQ